MTPAQDPKQDKNKNEIKRCKKQIMKNSLILKVSGQTEFKIEFYVKCRARFNVQN